MNCSALEAFRDNYIWMLDDGHRAVVVDPGEAQPVARALQARSLQLSGILVTHHHADHVGGLAALRAAWPEAVVWGPAREAIAGLDHRVAEGDRLELPLSPSADGRPWQATVLEVPGHTAGHVAYWVHSGAASASTATRTATASELAAQGSADDAYLFCGDALFLAGCGRLFEGTPDQLATSLAKLAALPAPTWLCCAHEYSESNLRFAAAVEPENPAIAVSLARVQAQRAAGQPSLPSRLGEEPGHNPFLRCAQPAVVQAVRNRGVPADDPVAVLAALREWKNTF